MERLLQSIKSEGGIGIKSSFEDEGQSLENIQKLNIMCSNAQLKRYLKVGGCEAKTDIALGINCGATAIIAPMVETSYASKKFYNCNVTCSRGITIETITALTNILQIIEACPNLDFIVIGRCDLIGSLGISKKEINSDIVFEYIKNALSKVRDIFPNIKIGLGGAISTEAHMFLNNIYKMKLIDFIETRHVVFPASIIETNYSKFCHLSKLFETQWLEMQIASLKYRYDNQHARLDYVSNRN